MWRSVEVQCTFVVVPHDKVTCSKQIFNSAAVAAIGYAQAFLDISRAERKRVTILVAAQVEVQT